MLQAVTGISHDLVHAVLGAYCHVTGGNKQTFATFLSVFWEQRQRLHPNHKYLTLPNRHILKVAGRLKESQNILDNNPAAGLARAVAKAWELYGSER